MLLKPCKISGIKFALRQHSFLGKGGVKYCALIVRVLDSFQYVELADFFIHTRKRVAVNPLDTLGEELGKKWLEDRQTKRCV